MASGTSGYGNKDYWDSRYEQQDGKYDWYLGYDAFKDQMLPFLNVGPGPNDENPSNNANDGKPRSDSKVLVVGCGNSDLSEDMVNDGFKEVISIDYSPVVVEKMKQRQPHLNFQEMDVRKMDFKKGAFDIVVDKGTLDAILCGSDSAKNADSMLSECHRVLAPKGVFVIVTYGTPQSRMSYSDKPKFGWKITQDIVGKTRYMYVMQKET